MDTRYPLESCCMQGVEPNRLKTRTAGKKLQMFTRGHFEGSEMSSKLRDFRQKKSRQKRVILGQSSILNTFSIFNPNHHPQSSSSNLNPHPQSAMLILILNLELPIPNSCSKIATKVRDLRPKMSSKVRDSGQNVRTHRVQCVQLFPALSQGLHC